MKARELKFVEIFFWGGVGVEVVGLVGEGSVINGAYPAKLYIENTYFLS